MECEHCGAEMMLLRRSDADMGEILWFRCRVCDSGQMRSLPASTEPDSRTSTLLGPRLGRLARRWGRLIARGLKQKAD